MSAGGGVLRYTTLSRVGRQSFQLTASNVTATLRTLLGRDVDFIGTLRALLTVQPHVSPTGFSEYYAELTGEQRQVGAVGSGVVWAVPAKDLTAFEVRRDSDPSFQALLGKWLLPAPRGRETRYCLLLAGRELIQMNALTATLIQEDWCQRSSALGSYQGPLLARGTDSGDTVALVVDAPWIHTVFLEAAVYAQGRPLDTVPERRAAVMGWVVSSFDIPAVISAAVGHNPGLSVRLYEGNPGERQQLVGQLGATPAAGAMRQTTPLSLDGNWTVTVLGHPLTDGLSAGQQGILLFLMGTAISVLVALVVRSRQRALELVSEKTAELRHRTLHDPLTGLPNRVLGIDRGEQMLGRARRNQTVVAALYIDLDGFKQVNDTYGHAAGDELLQLVAGRLELAVRKSDTAARLAGDEFVVLLDSSQLEVRPEIVAERIREALGEPYELACVGGREVSLSASIGVALGRHRSAEALLAAADAAMYSAKSAGKDRYVVSPGPAL